MMIAAHDTNVPMPVRSAPGPVPTPEALAESGVLFGTTSGRDLSESFLQLLVAQLNNQNPLDPRDGAEFLADLVSLSTLSELVAIRKTLSGEPLAPGAGGGFGEVPETAPATEPGEPGAHGEQPVQAEPPAAEPPPAAA